MTKSERIAHELNVDNANEIFREAMRLWNVHDKPTDALKAIMCSAMNTKECMLAVYFIGHIQSSYEHCCGDIAKIAVKVAEV